MGINILSQKGFHMLLELNKGKSSLSIMHWNNKASTNEKEKSRKEQNIGL